MYEDLTLYVIRAVAVVAMLLNFTEDAAYFMKRSENYRNIWDSRQKLMCPRSISGKLYCPVDPQLLTWLIRDDGYTEGAKVTFSTSTF